MKTNNPLAGYTVSELHSILPGERHAVRDEALRRHNKAAARLAKMQKEVNTLEMLYKAACAAHECIHPKPYLVQDASGNGSFYRCPDCSSEW